MTAADDGRLASIETLLTERDLRYNERFDAQEKANRLALDAAQKATDAALAAAEKANAIQALTIEKWQSSANEWRAAMNDREAKFMPRAEYEESRKASRSFTLAVVATSSTLLGVIIAALALALR